MHAFRQEILPPSGVEFLASLKLTPACLGTLHATASSSPRHELAARVLCNVVVARSNLLRIFEVREEAAPINAQYDQERDRKAKVRKGTEAVEGEVEMDEHGEGYINIAKSAPEKSAAPLPMVTRFYFIREHRLHGTVTGLEAVKTMASLEDRLDRLIVSFKDAKIALLEWSEAIHDLLTVSIHTYERAPQIMSLVSMSFTAVLRTDPLSRCVALSLPKDAIAILPFHQTQAELDIMEQDQNQTKDIPYFPSFILDLNSDVDESIHNVIDFVFLPGFNNPTVAVLFQTQQTWIGRLKEYKDTVKLIIFTLDLVTQHYPIITSVTGLPLDSMSLLPCATSLGGVVVLTSNSIIYVDQSSRRVPLPVNGWATRLSDMQYMTPSAEEQRQTLHLEGSQSLFVDDKTMFVVLKDGTIYPIEIGVDGKTVSRLTMGPVLAQTTIPAVVRRVDDEYLFVGSIVGASVLLKTTRVEQEVENALEVPAAVVDVDNSMDFDDDDDIYGVSTGTANAPTTSLSKAGSLVKQKRMVIHLSLCDSLPASGPISDISFSLAKNGDRHVPELVSVTGAGHLGGFTLFQRDFPVRTKRKLHAIGGARGVWSLPIRQPVKANGISYERPVNPFQSEHDTIIMSTDANPSPGLSRIASRSSKGDISITTRIPGTTVGAASFFQRTAILHVMSNSIRVLEPDGTERQIIKDMDGNIPRPKIRACSICDPFVLILRDDDSIGLFIGETERGKIRRKDMSAMGDKTSRYLTGCFYMDTTGLFEAQLTVSATTDAMAGADKNATSTLQAAVSAGSKSQWLILVRPQGIMEIWTLPKLTLVFSTSAISTLPNIMVDSCDPPALSMPQDPPRKPQDLDIDQILFAPLGESVPRPFLFVFLRCGQLAVYEIRPASVPNQAPDPRATYLNLKFIKSIAKAFEIQRPEETEKGALAEQKRISRLFIPFATATGPRTNLSGVFFTGDRPSWIIATDKSGVNIYPSGHAVVHSFTACSLWGSQREFLLYSDEGPSLVELIAEYQLGGPLPFRMVPKGRAYSSVVYDPSTSLVVAASSLQARFASFDEDGNRIWEPDAQSITEPVCDCSTLELISPDLWVTMDGYEFATNEFVNAVACVSLETTSTDTGIKDFVAVGTSIDRGEDLAVKGATYVFEIVEVVPDPSLAPKRWYKLRLRCRDDAKGPVTAICGFNGYLVSSMGQKIFVRAFDLDERLVGVAFLDVGVSVTSLRSLKNLLLIGDAVKSVSFVAFQEDPYKLVVLAKDTRHICVSSVDFVFTSGEMSIVTCDEEGIIRMYEYNPHDPESRDGRYLLLRTEFHAQNEYRASALVAWRTKEDPILPQSKLICGSTDGSLSCLTPIEESVFKRLQLLQGQLTRNIQHVAGLNPKAFRIVKNDHVSKPLSKGILDGHLLSYFEALSITRQEEMTKQIGQDKGAILRDWTGVVGSGAW